VAIHSARQQHKTSPTHGSNIRQQPKFDNMAQQPKNIRQEQHEITTLYSNQHIRQQQHKTTRTT